jgi:hydroxypyruvate reductase
VTNLVIGSNRLALSTSEQVARQLGYQTLILTSAIEGEAKELARFIGAIMKETWQADQPVDKPACILLGGEPTVRISGKGKGGRNQELCLALALVQLDFPFVFISCGSDGTDGPTDAAGARVTHTTLQRAEALGLDGIQLLKNNDSYHFFKPLGDLIMTGPTRTNVMDLIFALVPVTKS